jgi:alkanesulfonate monooxygenase SsuD/methylene tetrahydromethanopterin reductase-like flavin-dependent oxidoreductase (luciferase family)
MEYGIHLAMPSAGSRPPNRLAYDLQTLHEGDGAFVAAWVSDHLQNEDHPILEGWTTVTYLAALAPTYRFGHLVLGQGYRNPALLAKMAATLQVLSGGRFVLGLGAGWQEDEYRAYDYPYPSAGMRIEQLGEAIDVVRALWTTDPATYVGKHYRVAAAHCQPQPNPLPRILVGGQGPKLMGLVAEKADAWNWDGPVELYRPGYDRLVRACADIGREIVTVHLTASVEVYFPADTADFPAPHASGYEDFMTVPLGPTPTEARREIERLAELGVAELVCYFWDLDSLRRFRDEIVAAA